MKIYFVRHGNSNYQYDCLTDIGHLQAEVCAERLENEGIQKIFSSSMGRAVATAEHTSLKLGIEINKVDFMKELWWRSKTDKPIFKDGHPWHIVDDMVSKGENIFDMNWEENENFSSSIIGATAKMATDGFDEWLKNFGYERAGDYYRVVGDDTDQTVAMFSYAGAISAVFSHLFSLAFPFVCQTIRLNFTSITIVEFGNEKGALTFPRLTLLNDARHIEGINSEIFFGN